MSCAWLIFELAVPICILLIVRTYVSNPPNTGTVRAQIHNISRATGDSIKLELVDCVSAVLNNTHSLSANIALCGVG